MQATAGLVVGRGRLGFPRPPIFHGSPGAGPRSLSGKRGCPCGGEHCILVTISSLLVRFLLAALVIIFDWPDDVSGHGGEGLVPTLTA